MWYLHWWSSRSRRITSNYFLLLQCSHEQNGRKFWSVYIFLTYTLHELLTYSDNIYFFIYLARGRIFLFTSRTCPCGLHPLSRVWFFFFGWRIAFINFVMISTMSYSSRFSIYWHLVTAWIQLKLLLFGTQFLFLQIHLGCCLSMDHPLTFMALHRQARGYNS